MSAPRVEAGADISLRIGQRVRHRDYKGQRVTGTVRSLSVDAEQGLMVDIVLDAPIVIPAGHGFQASDIHTQCAPAHEFAPFDDRDEVIDGLMRALVAMVRHHEGPAVAADQRLLVAAEAAIAKATGAAS